MADLIESMKKVQLFQNVSLFFHYSPVQGWKLLHSMKEMFENSEKHELEFLDIDEPDSDDDDLDI